MKGQDVCSASSSIAVTLASRVRAASEGRAREGISRLTTSDGSQSLPTPTLGRREAGEPSPLAPPSLSQRTACSCTPWRRECPGGGPDAADVLLASSLVIAA